MRSAREATELRQFFQIKSDLASAARSGSTEDVEFHIAELSGIRLHTTNDRLRDACSAAIDEGGKTEVHAA